MGVNRLTRLTERGSHETVSSAIESSIGVTLPPKLQNPRTYVVNHDRSAAEKVPAVGDSLDNGCCEKCEEEQLANLL